MIKLIQENINKLKDILCLWIERINIVKMPIPPKAIYTFNAICQKSAGIFHRKRKNVKFAWNHKNTK